MAEHRNRKPHAVVELMHPTDLLKQQMGDGSVEDLALCSGIPKETLVAILEKRRWITSAESKKLGAALGIGLTRFYVATAKWREAGGK